MDRNDFASRVVEQTDRMYRIAYVLLHNDEDCRDAMQEAALKAWEKAKPVLDELFRWVEPVHYSPKSPGGSAMEYPKKQKAYLLYYRGLRAFSYRESHIGKEIVKDYRECRNGKYRQNIALFRL